MGLEETRRTDPARSIDGFELCASVRAELCELAARWFPREAVAAIVTTAYGRSLRARELPPGTRHRFRVRQTDLDDALNPGDTIVGWFHSHVRGAAVPSHGDVSSMTADLVHVIAAAPGPDPSSVTLRAFTIDANGFVTDVPIGSEGQP